MTPDLLPGLDVSGFVFQAYVVPAGNPVLLILASALGSSLWLNVCICEFAVAVYLKVWGFHTKWIRPGAPLSFAWPTCS